ncbi:DUF7455 domain-containing protein [Pseudonocardia cypriaca]|uniref:DUF7455 domain-containing protein n=1 Tax=Pseudonocardia cypriaca TaxID=882449 RepID=A0A543G9B5_9PSEU|nr:hypothetical protein [Pseudonocardia cypriaca]TQM42668.1 hypothetical protein FB388_0004 [Pseudonocardia cypriaca]TQM42679.1 hypothetical protein FB388_0015 [Pseudonocardia cypriaca]
MNIADALPVLTRQDRCDRCRATAQVRAVLPAGNDLLFCEHHARKHAPRLREIGALLSPEP